jgi:hypothetical protein
MKNKALVLAAFIFASCNKANDDCINCQKLSVNNVCQEDFKTEYVYANKDELSSMDSLIKESFMFNDLTWDEIKKYCGDTLKPQSKQ